MGCICTKAFLSGGGVETKREKAVIRLSRRLFIASNRRDDVVVLDADSAVGNNVSNVNLMPKPQENAALSSPLILEEGGKKRKHVQVALDAPLLQKESAPPRKAVGDTRTGEAELDPRISQVPNGVQVEHVAAGWPSWLVSVAGDAIKGWLPRKADSFERLNKIGQGTYSSVYKARDLKTGKLVALKKVRFVNMDPESVQFMAREIHILRRLDHPNVVKLEGLIASKISCSLYLVFEYMEHDLAGLAASPTAKFSESQIKCYMQQLLCGLDHCHGLGVLHRDIKGSNLLIDNNGILKIADFGLATFFNPYVMQSLTSRVVTLWYRPPELLLGATKYGIAVDLWSTGCILAELLAGKPIMPGRTEFFNTKPFACDPSSLPKYPPSKELDAKLRDEETKRQKAAAIKGHGSESVKKAPKESQAIPVNSLESEERINHKGFTDKHKKPENIASGFHIDHPNGLIRNGSLWCKKVGDDERRIVPVRSLSNVKVSNRAELKTQRSYVCRAGDMSNFSGLLTTAGSGMKKSHWPEHRPGYHQLDVPETSEKQGRTHHCLDRPPSSQKKEERAVVKESTSASNIKKSRIQYSGPLIRQGENFDEMLKEHERLIQHAVRKVRIEKENYHG